MTRLLPILALASAAVALAVARIVRDARAWREWDTDEHEAGVPMTWPPNSWMGVLPQTMTTPSVGGWWCGVCRLFVPFGVTHGCSTYQPTTITYGRNIQ